MARLNDLETDVAEVATQAEAAGASGVSNVTQYTGSIGTGATLDVTISAVTLATTFVLLTVTTSSPDQYTEAWTAHFTTTTNVRLTRTTTGNSGTYVLQVIEN